jgi:hypothetical protein
LKPSGRGDWELDAWIHRKAENASGCVSRLTAFIGSCQGRKRQLHPGRLQAGYGIKFVNRDTFVP